MKQIDESDDTLDNWDKFEQHALYWPLMIFIGFPLALAYVMLQRFGVI